MTLTAGTKYNALPGLDTFSESWELLLPLSTNKCVYVYADQAGSGEPTARVMNISGTTISSIGSAAQLDSTGINSNTMRGVALSSSTFILIWSKIGASTNREAVVCSVSGDTITPGAVSTIITQSISGWVADVGKVTSTKAIVCYRDRDDSDKGKAIAFNITGTTIGTPGSAATFESGSAATNFGVEELDQSSKVICTYRISGGTPCKAVCLSVSGTTITPGTPISLEGTETTLKPRTLRMSNSKALAFYEQTSGLNDTIHVHEIENTTGTTIVSNGSQGFGDLTTGDITYGYARLTDTIAVVVYLSSGDEKAVEITLTGGQPTVGTPLTLESSVASVDNMGIAAVDVDKAAIIYSLIDGNVLSSSLVATTFSYDLVVSSGGLAKEAMATDADGTYVFVALEDDSTGNQGVFRVVRPTSGTPTVTNVYDAVGGSAGNVAMTPDPDTVIFYGNFGTDKGVTVHTISSGANADASPASISTDVIAPLRVDPADVDHWIAVNVDDQDGLETEDGGANWSTLNSALGQTVEAMAALFFGAYFPASVWIGGDDATDENLAYSPNDLNNTREDTSAGLKAVTKITGIDVMPDYGN